MTAIIKYTVFELNRILGSESHLSLQRVELGRYGDTEFDTEEEAIQALIDDKKTHEGYLILKQVRIND